jgi:hypothetical protein
MKRTPRYYRAEHTMSGRLRRALSHPTMRGLLAVVTAITLIACGDDSQPTAVYYAGPPVAVSITPAGLSLVVGGEGRLTADAVDLNGRSARTSLIWSSADTAIATVGKSDGTVTAISAGTTTVTVSAGTVRATATVSVRPPDPPIGITISPTAFTIIAGAVVPLSGSAYDSTGKTISGSLEWSSADPAVATVGKSDGIVTAIAAGTTTMTAAIGALHATVTVSVIPLAASFAFTRWTNASDGSSTSERLTFSVTDGMTRTLPPLPLPDSGPLGAIGRTAWSPDGTLLAFEGMHATFDWPQEWYDYTSDLYVVDAAASAASPWRALTSNGLSQAPSWSPDGKRIAYLHRDSLFVLSDIYVIDAAGGAPVPVVRTGGAFAPPIWSPDGTRLAFTDWNVGSGDIFVVNADGSGLTNVTRSPGTDFQPSWSPDGTRLAFVSTRFGSSGAFRPDVFVVDVSGNNVRRLTSLNQYSVDPVWSPDGSQIMFSSGNALYVMPADGSTPGRLTTPPPKSVDRSPMWKR